MARLLGVDLPRNKKVLYGLTYIFGIGLTRAKAIIEKSGVEPTTLVKDLTESDILSIRDALSGYVLEGDLRRSVGHDINRLSNIGTYRGQRHKRRLPVRGQRTHTNARTRKGKSVAIAGKKKVTK